MGFHPRATPRLLDDMPVDRCQGCIPRRQAAADHEVDALLRQVLPEHVGDPPEHRCDPASSAERCVAPATLDRVDLLVAVRGVWYEDANTTIQGTRGDEVMSATGSTKGVPFGWREAGH